MFTLNCKGRLLVADTPLVMGIMNVTPDSFYKGSRFSGTRKILAQAEKMLSDGAAILDIGGQSTKPGNTPLKADEEMQRVIPAIEAVYNKFPAAFISVDTFYAAVAKEAVAAGASLVNDISAGAMDDKMIDTVAGLQVPYVLMHMQGSPQTMQQNPFYKNVITEVLDFFIKKTAALKSAGIQDVIIDPGFGFGKTIEHNFELLKNLSVFHVLEKPLLLGISRKSMVYKIIGATADDALNGTTVLNTVGLLNGASILRVHDVREAKETINLVIAVKK